jgi:putative endonuclease
MSATVPPVPPPSVRAHASGHNQRLGAWGEAFAARHLCARGMVLLDRNWRCDLGEVDLVLREGETLVVCEVKTRTSHAYGAPLEAVDRRKAERLQRLAWRWARTHDLRPRDIRIDLVGVTVPVTGAPTLEHVAGVG